MEERLFLIGLVMLGYASAARYTVKRPALQTKKRISVFHALFCFLAAFSAMVVITVSWAQQGDLSTGPGRSPEAR